MGRNPAPWIDHPTFRVMHNEIYGFTDLDEELSLVDSFNPYVEYNYGEWQAKLYHTGYSKLDEMNFWVRSDVTFVHIDPTECTCDQ